MFILNDKLTELSEKYSDGEKCIVLLADKFLGKTTLANKLIQAYGGLRIAAINSKNALADTMICKGLTPDNNDLVNLIKIKQYVEERFNDGVIVFDDFSEYGPDVQNTIIKAIPTLVEDGLKVLIVIDDIQCIGIDVSLEFYELITITCEEFHGFLANNYAKVFKNITNEAIIEKIVSSSKNFNDILRFKNSVDKQNISDEELNCAIDEILKKRLTDLSDDLLDVLKKSSAIGESFDDVTVKEVFEIEKLTDKLNLLTQVSEIIYLGQAIDQFNTSAKNAALYEFASKNVYADLRSQIPPDEFSSWCKLLGGYFHRVASSGRNRLIAYRFYCQSFKFYCDAAYAEEIIAVGLQLLTIAATLDKKYQIVDICEKIYAANPHDLLKAYIFIYELMTLFELGENARLVERIDKCKYDRINHTGVLWDNYVKIYQAYGYYVTGREKLSAEILAQLLNKEQSKDLIFDTELMFHIHSLAMTVYYNQGNKKSAKDSFALACNYAQLLDSKTPFYRLITKCSMVYDNDLALLKLREAEEYFKSKNLNIDTAKCLHNIGVIYYEQGEYEEAEKYFVNARNIFKENLSNHKFYSINNLGAVYMFKGMFDDAISIFNQIIEYDYLQDDFTLIEVYFNLSAYYYKKKEDQLCMAMQAKAEEILNKTQNQGESYYYNLFLNMHKALYNIEANERDDALLYLNNIDAHDEEYKAVSELLVNRLANREYSHDYGKKVMDIANNNIFPHTLIFWE